MKVVPTILLAIALSLAGCAGSPGGGGSRAAETVVQFGVIEAVTPIELDDSSYAGASVGGVFGQAGGSGGGGRGGAVGAILGGVLGSTLGHRAGIATKPGLEIWVRLDENGKSAYVMQPGKPDEFKIGDHVRLLRKGGKARVEPLLAPASPPQPR